MGVVFNLAAELQVLRDRVRVLEHLLEAKGVVARSAIDDFRGTAEQEQAIAADRREYVAKCSSRSWGAPPRATTWRRAVQGDPQSNRATAAFQGFLVDAKQYWMSQIWSGAEGGLSPPLAG